MSTDATLSPMVGQLAPDFTLNSTAGKAVTLSSLRGHKSVLLAFFPMAFTSVCTSELCAFSEDFEQFTGADVEVLPISVDAVPSLKEYRNKYQMKTELLSDFKREASRAYGVLHPEAFFANRAYFLIDQAGMVRWAHIEAAIGQKRENAEILNAIKSVTSQLSTS